MQESTFTALEHLFLALSDKTRLRLLALMVDGEVPVGMLAESLGESQPKISRHLAYLRSAGLVSTRREGKWIYYGIEDGMDPAVTRVLDATLRSILSGSSERSQPISTPVVYEEYSYEVNEAEEYVSDWVPQELEIHLL